MSHRTTDALRDEVIWLNRGTKWIEWARLLGLHVVTVRQEMAMRGWRRNSMGALTHAPCAECGTQAEVWGMGDTRLCPQCRQQLEVFDPVALYREELAKRRRA